ncbi:OsmC family protein [candidate division WOR-3 bacterium]|nr:OsmC family protein [candidate division WOR-3 bacterium]
MEVTSKTTWRGKMKFTGTAWSGRELTMDAGAEVGGDDSAVRPMETVLIGLAGCTGMDVVSLLKKMRVEFNKLELNIRADKTEEHPHVFSRIDIEYVIHGKDIDPAKLERAIELSQDRYCSVSAMLRKHCPVNHTYRIVKP